MDFGRPNALLLSEAQRAGRDLEDRAVARERWICGGVAESELLVVPFLFSFFGVFFLWGGGVSFFFFVGGGGRGGGGEWSPIFLICSFLFFWRGGHSGGSGVQPIFVFGGLEANEDTS